MPVPKRKRSRSRRDKRFANKGMDVASVGACKNCQAPLVPHVVCNSCGFFKGRKVFATKADRLVKRAEKAALIKERKKSKGQRSTDSAE